MTTPTLYIYDLDGDLAIYRAVETVTAYLAADAAEAATNIINPFPSSSPDADSVVIAADDAEGQYDCDGPAEALALRDALNRALVKAALAGAPACVVDIRDPDGSKARDEAAAAKRERIERDRIALGRK